MDIEKINAAGQKAIRLARKHALSICLTLIDSGGHIVYQARMDNANFMTNRVSFLKAKTAFLFKCPSHMLRAITEKVPSLLQTIQQEPGDTCMLEGGLPVKEHQKIIGGIGVSGGNFEQDLLIANAFVDFLNEDGNGN